MKGNKSKMQCLPLYSLLLAVGNPVVDLLSLDIEGAELQVVGIKNSECLFVSSETAAYQTLLKVAILRSLKT